MAVEQEAAASRLRRWKADLQTREDALQATIQRTPMARLAGMITGLSPPRLIEALSLVQARIEELRPQSSSSAESENGVKVVKSHSSAPRRARSSTLVKHEEEEAFVGTDSVVDESRRLSIREQARREHEAELTRQMEEDERARRVASAERKQKEASKEIADTITEGGQHRKDSQIRQSATKAPADDGRRLGTTAKTQRLQQQTYLAEQKAKAEVLVKAFEQVVDRIEAKPVIFETPSKASTGPKAADVFVTTPSSSPAREYRIHTMPEDASPPARSKVEVSTKQQASFPVLPAFPNAVTTPMPKAKYDPLTMNPNGPFKAGKYGTPKTRKTVGKENVMA